MSCICVSFEGGLSGRLEPRRERPPQNDANAHLYIRNKQKTYNMKMNAHKVKFHSTKRRNRAARGQLHNVGTSSTTGETDREFSRRSGQLSFAQEKQRSSAVGRVIAIIVVILLVVAVGYGVGQYVFYNQLGARFAFSAADAPTGLSAQPAGQGAYYVAVAADLDASNGNNSIDALQLVRVDPAAKQLTVVSIPPNLAVTLSDNKTHAIKDALDVGGSGSVSASSSSASTNGSSSGMSGGYTELISALSSFAGVNISQFVKTDESGIRSLAQKMGGFHVNVSEEIDDPTAGSIYIAPGEQTLEADEIMVFLRASNFKKSKTTQYANQALILAMGVEYFASGGNGGSNGTSSNASTGSVEARLDGAQGIFTCTWNGGRALCDAFSALSVFSAANAYRASVPGDTENVNNETLFIDTTSSWLAMMKKVDAGEEPVVEAKGSINDIYAGAYSVTVKNGSGIDGGASSIADILRGAGFNVTSTGNADSYVYNETLVIYGNDTLKTAADAAVEVLGVGRATEAGVYYAYDTDLLVILGSDWKPTK